MIPASGQLTTFSKAKRSLLLTSWPYILQSLQSFLGRMQQLCIVGVGAWWVDIEYGEVMIWINYMNTYQKWCETYVVWWHVRDPNRPGDSASTFSASSKGLNAVAEFPLSFALALAFGLLSAFLFPGMAVWPMAPTRPYRHCSSVIALQLLWLALLGTNAESWITIENSKGPIGQDWWSIFGSELESWKHLKKK